MTDRFGAVLRLALPSAGELLLGTLVGIVHTYLVVTWARPRWRRWGWLPRRR